MEAIGCGVGALRGESVKRHGRGQQDEEVERLRDRGRRFCCGVVQIECSRDFCSETGFPLRWGEIVKGLLVGVGDGGVDYAFDVDSLLYAGDFVYQLEDLGFIADVVSEVSGFDNVTMNAVGE